MEPRFYKIPVCVGDVSLNVAKGHFATRNSHTNYFIDVTSQQSSIRDADAVAQQLAQRSQTQFLMVDTILCMDGTRVIGTCLAQKLTQGGFRSINAGKEIYVLRENVGTSGKLIFRDNARFMLEGKNVLLLLASVTTGGTVRRGIDCVKYYQGQVAGIAAVYSHQKEIDGIPVVSLFNTNDIPDYASYLPEECPMCREKRELDAVVDKYGYSAL
ncbi:orotate phosphoribosyltransferase [Colidextribacter sp. OB.20]|uniref:orotate phosphoribosyltransferase n=1 Tax=Colidextribacter sp. OB.20 TaxID=2304568 RepID=UPI00136FD9D3|nr:orotate phosphoribosyltransferase [Colidextribacter sp. OB.20]NBI08883.1 orotate phosphoribosyltransferase [Colidextribacter sp. OB.20]